MWWLVACAPRLPSARLDSLEVVGLGWEQVDAELRVVVDNPLRVEVPITGLRWTVSTAGRPFAYGASPERLVLAADAETPVPIPIHLRYADLPGPIDGVDAHAVVSIDLETPARPVTLELSHDFVLPPLPAPTLDLVALVPWWEGSTGHLTLTVGLGLPAWVGTGWVDWSVAADDRVLGLGRAELGGDHLLTADVGMDPSAVAASSWDAWRGRVTAVHLDLHGRLETGYGALPIALARDLVLSASDNAPPPR